VSKLLERVIAKQLIAYTKDNDLLPDLQSAYLAHRSTETAFLKVLSEILMARDSGNLAVLMMLDLSAALESVDHATLLHRLPSDYLLCLTCFVAVLLLNCFVSLTLFDCYCCL